MSPLTRERIGIVVLLQKYDYSVFVADFLMSEADDLEGSERKTQEAGTAAVDEYERQLRNS